MPFRGPRKAFAKKRFVLRVKKPSRIPAVTLLATRRFYYDNNNFAAGLASNKPDFDAGWSQTSGALRGVALNSVKAGTAYSTNGTQVTKPAGAGPLWCLIRQYVSAPLPAQTIKLGSRIRGQILCQEVNFPDQVTAAIIVKVCNGDGTAIRGTLVSYLPTVQSEQSNWTAVFTNRYFPQLKVANEVAILDGDRLVVEIGATYWTGTTGSIAATDFGDLKTTGDLAIDETTIRSPSTPDTPVPWLEFLDVDPVSGTITSTGETTETLDLEDRISKEGLSKVTMAVERNLHEFRAGDVTLTLDDGDGAVSELFQGALPTDRFRIDLMRDEVTHFAGTIQPVDSIRSDLKARLMELSALDLSKVAEEYDASGIQRAQGYALTATAASGQALLTLNTTALLFNGDKLELLLNNGTKETIEIALVTSSTQVQATANLANSFTAASTLVTLVTAFPRFRTPTQLVNSLLDLVAGYDGRNIRLTGATGKIPVFSDQATNRLDQVAVPTAMTQKGGKHFLGFASTSFEQVDPASDWVPVSPSRTWIDWTPYRTQAQGEPSTFANSPSGDPDLYGVDFTPGALVAYFTPTDGGVTATVNLKKYTSTDGLTWAGPTQVAVLGTSTEVGGMPCKSDYDPKRNRVYFMWSRGVDHEFGYYDLNASTKVLIDHVARSSSSPGYAVYSAEADALFLMCPTRNSLQLWQNDVMIREVAVPRSRVYQHTPGTQLKTARHFNGTWVFTGFPDNVPTVYFSTDGLATIVEIPLTPALPNNTTLDSRVSVVNGQFRVAIIGQPSQGSVQATYFIGAPSFAGVIPYADFEGQSVSAALDDLAILTNAVFYVDHDAVANFVSREIDSGATLKEIDALVQERKDDLIWVETYDYVEVSIGGALGKAGRKTSRSRNLSVSTKVGASTGVATAAAYYLLDFFGKRRRLARIALDDDNQPWRLLDPVRMDGTDWLIYGFERDLPGYELSMDLIEKVT